MVTRSMNRREFLKIIISGIFSLAIPSVKAESLEDKIEERMIDALHPKPRGFPLPKFKFPLEIKSRNFPIHVESSDIKYNIAFEYFKGPKGAGGALRTFVYLDKKNWYDNKGIKNLKIIYYSTKKTNLSKQIYEVNVNKHYKIVTHSPLEHVVLPGDYLVDKFKKSVYAVLKKVKVDKKDIDRVLWVKHLFDDIKEQEIIQRIIEKCLA